MHEICAMILTKVVWFLGFRRNLEVPVLKIFMGPVLFSSRFFKIKLRPIFGFSFFDIFEVKLDPRSRVG
jgi:hypothetical protein